MIILIYFIYLTLLLAIGYIAYRRTSDFSDYLIGARKLSAVPAALSAGASDMNAWLLLVLPGLAMTSGYSSFWLAGALLIGTWLNWLVVAPRFRVYARRAGNSLTLPAFLEQRFGDPSHVLRTVSGVFILLFFLCYTCAGLIAAGQLLNGAFELNYSIAVLICTASVLCYTQLGGFLGVVWSDVFQGLLMLAALIIVPWVALENMGGVDVALAEVSSRNPDLLDIWTDAEGKPLTLSALLTVVGIGLGYFGQPHILSRFIGIRSQESVSIARRIAVIWTGFCLAGACMIGLAAIGLLPEKPDDTDQVFLLMAQLLFDPLVASGLVIAILAAIMSTVDSQLLVAASSLSEDLYRGLFNRPASQTLLVKAGRRSVFILGLIAMVLAMDQQSSVLNWVTLGWVGLGAAFGPALIASLYWKRMNGLGALAGIVTGGISVIVWQQQQGGIFDLYAIYPGIVLSAGMIVVVSLVTPAPANSLRMIFETVRREVKH